MGPNARQEMAIKNLSNQEIKAIKRLRSLSATWPKTLWIYAADGELHVMRKVGGRHATVENGGMDQAQIIATIAIESDGGDW